LSVSRILVLSAQGERLSSLYACEREGVYLSAQRFVLTAVCHEEQPPKRGNVFERVKVIKWSVANRLLHAILGGTW